MQGRLEEALKILQDMARVNGHEFPPALKDRLELRILQEKTREKKKKKNVSVLDLCRYALKY